MVHKDKLREEFSQRLAQACKDYGLDVHGRGMAISRALGVTSRAVSKWLNAESIPRQDKLNELADYLQTDRLWLQHGEVNAGTVSGIDSSSGIKSGKKKPEFRTVPILANGHLINWDEHSRISSVDAGVDFLQTSIKSSGASFAFIIEDESMVSEFSVGDIVICDPKVKPIPGDFVMAQVGGSEETIFRRYRLISAAGVEPVFELFPLNNVHALHRSDVEKIRVIGVMVEHRKYRQAPKR